MLELKITSSSVRNNFLDLLKISSWQWFCGREFTMSRKFFDQSTKCTDAPGTHTNKRCGLAWQQHLLLPMPHNINLYELQLHSKHKEAFVSKWHVNQNTCNMCSAKMFELVSLFFKCINPRDLWFSLPLVFKDVLFTLKKNQSFSSLCSLADMASPHQVHPGWLMFTLSFRCKHFVFYQLT